MPVRATATQFVEVCRVFQEIGLVGHARDEPSGSPVAAARAQHATLCHLVTGSLPFAGKTSEEVLAKQVLESLSGDAIRDLRLSPQLHYFLEKMMAKEREIPFQDPKQLQTEVNARLEQLRVLAEQQEAEQERPKLGSRRSSMFEGGRRRRRRRS